MLEPVYCDVGKPLKDAERVPFETREEADLWRDSVVAMIAHPGNANSMITVQRWADSIVLEYRLRMQALQSKGSAYR